mgnify:FL=1
MSIQFLKLNIINPKLKYTYYEKNKQSIDKHFVVW